MSNGTPSNAMRSVMTAASTDMATPRGWRLLSKLALLRNTSAWPPTTRLLNPPDQNAKGASRGPVSHQGGSQGAEARRLALLRLSRQRPVGVFDPGDGGRVPEPAVVLLR